MDEEDFKTLFHHILYRFPTKEEISYHLARNITLEDMKKELLSCHERLSNHEKIIQKEKPSNLKIALMMIGHFRRFDDIFVKTWRNFKVLHPEVDIFIHTWNEKGLRSYEYWLDNTCDKPDFDLIIDVLKPVSFIREDHSALLPQFSMMEKYPDKKIYLSSGQHVPKVKDFSQFIMSQLYSIYTCFQSVKRFELVHDKKYDVVIKLRSDTLLYHPLIFKELLPKDVLYIHSRSHFHVDGGLGCLKCDLEFPERKHEFHSNDVCDVLNYGCSEVMEKYCNLYLHILDLLDQMHEDNQKTLETYPELERFLFVEEDTKDHIYYFGWCGDFKKNLKLFYPERLIREYLKDFWLLSDPYYL